MNLMLVLLVEKTATERKNENNADGVTKRKAEG
jgi:hypothetical protein